MKPPILGSVNASGTATLFDKNNHVVGYCFDTPNAFAAACILNKEVIKMETFYQYFGKSVRTRNNKDIQERIKMLKDSKDLNRFNIKWNK